MKLLFSEVAPDYANYLYPYVIWAVPEPGESPADFFAAGFLPASPSLDRFYVCRQLRVPLTKFQLSSENRRILRKGEGIEFQSVSRNDFDFTAERKSSWLAYAAKRFGEGIMHEQRLDTLMASPVISHLLVFRDRAKAVEIGTVLLYLEPPRAAFYYYAFYDLHYVNQNLGMFMMTSAVQWFAEQGYEYIHLGTCYSEPALYKTQFTGVEFFNGYRWSTELDELKFLVRRQKTHRHLLQDSDYQCWHQGLAALAAESRFVLPLKSPSRFPAP